VFHSRSRDNDFSASLPLDSLDSYQWLGARDRPGPHGSPLPAASISARLTRLPPPRAQRWRCVSLLSAFIAIFGVSRIWCGSASAIGIDWVTVGDSGNLPDAYGYGAVATSYRIMKNELTNDNYAAFLNAVDPEGTNPADTYSSLMRFFGGIENTGITSGSRYLVKPNMGDKPVTFTSWFNAAQFANWLQNGEQTYPSSAAGATGVNQGAYTITNIASGIAPQRNSAAVFWVPSADEWKKAAYFKGGAAAAGCWTYPTQSDSPPTAVMATSTGIGMLGGISPVPGGNSANFNRGADWGGKDGNVTTVGTNGGPSTYGAFDMGGNVAEWTDEAGFDATRRILRGGNFAFDSAAMAGSSKSDAGAAARGDFFGIRLSAIAPTSIPVIDPSAAGTVVAIVAGFLAWFERRRGRRGASAAARQSPTAPQRRAPRILMTAAQAAAALAAALILGRPVAAATTDTVQYLSSPASYGAVRNGLNLEYGTNAFPPLTETALEAYQVQGSGPVTLTFRMHADTGSFRFNFGYYKYLPALNSIDTSTTAGKQAYATTALAAGNAVLVFNDVIHDPGATTTKTVNGGDLLGFFLIPDDTLANFQTSPGSFAVTGVGSATFGIGGPKRWPFFGYAAANPGGRDQLMSFAGTSKATGKRSNMFAWEDISRASLPGDFYCDNAFNDLIFAVEGVEAAVTSPAAIPEIDPAGLAGVVALVAGALGLRERRRFTL